MTIITGPDGLAITDRAGFSIADSRPDTTGHLAMLQALLPPGPAWTREAEADLTALLDALAVELTRIDSRGEDILDEADPSTTSELLEEWEEMVGLPEDCADLAETEDERRAAVVAKLTARGGQSEQYYADIAEALGIEITYTYFTPFRAGISCAGDRVYSTAWRHVWQVNVEEGDLSDILECMLTSRKPAHTTVIFNYI